VGDIRQVRVTRSLSQILDLIILVANNHRVPRIDYRCVEYTFVFTLEQKALPPPPKSGHARRQ
jgi:hypothetical protein